MNRILMLLMLSLSTLLAVCGCGTFYSEHHHVNNSMCNWSALGGASNEELSDSVHRAIANMPGVVTVIELYPSFTGEAIWPDSAGRNNKLWFEFDFGNGNADERGVYFTALYFAAGDSGSASAFDVSARAGAKLVG